MKRGHNVLLLVPGAAAGGVASCEEAAAIPNLPITVDCTPAPQPAPGCILCARQQRSCSRGLMGILDSVQRCSPVPWQRAQRFWPGLWFSLNLSPEARVLLEQQGPGTQKPRLECQKASPRGAAGCPAAEKQQDQLSRGTLAAESSRATRGDQKPTHRLCSPWRAALDEAG